MKPPNKSSILDQNTYDFSILVISDNTVLIHYLKKQYTMEKLSYPLGYKSLLYKEKINMTKLYAAVVNRIHGKVDMPISMPENE